MQKSKPQEINVRRFQFKNRHIKVDTRFDQRLAVRKLIPQIVNPNIC